MNRRKGVMGASEPFALDGELWPGCVLYSGCFALKFEEEGPALPAGPPFWTQGGRLAGQTETEAIQAEGALATGEACRLP